MNDDKAGPADKQCEKGRVEALERDLGDALATVEWQRRSLSRLKAVIAWCQDERRAPTSEEVNDALHDGTRMAA